MYRYLLGRAEDGSVVASYSELGAPFGVKEGAASDWCAPLVAAGCVAKQFNGPGPLRWVPLVSIEAAEQMLVGTNQTTEQGTGQQSSRGGAQARDTVSSSSSSSSSAVDLPTSTYQPSNLLPYAPGLTVEGVLTKLGLRYEHSTVVAFRALTVEQQVEAIRKFQHGGPSGPGRSNQYMRTCIDDVLTPARAALLPDFVLDAPLPSTPHEPSNYRVTELPEVDKTPFVAPPAVPVPARSLARRVGLRVAEAVVRWLS